MLDTNAKGAVAEQAIVLAAMKLEIPVLRPIAEHGRSDLVLDIAGRLFRVQCKWGSLDEHRSVISVGLRTSRHTSNGYVRTTYDASEIDLFGVYCGDLDQCFLLPIERFGGQGHVHLRLATPRNNQAACINLADDFDFEGAIAQLGERLHGMQEVVGSSPTSSTNTAPRHTVVSAGVFRDGFGDWMDRVASGQQVIVTRHGKPRIRLSPAV
jgi:prevent-host-death family protein